QPLDARIKTKTGWKQMGELRFGDELASVDGRPSRVSGIFPQGLRQVYRVRFSDGRSTEFCAEHLWRVHCRAWREPRLLTTEEVARHLGWMRSRHRLWIDVPTGDYGPSAPLPLDPWLLGALLGQGKLSGSSAMCFAADADMAVRVGERSGEGVARRAAGGGDHRLPPGGGAPRPPP